MTTLVHIRPIGNRAKNRVREHGEIMELIKQETYQLQPAIFVRSIHPNTKDDRWFGWIDQVEADWDIIELPVGCPYRHYVQANRYGTSSSGYGCKYTGGHCVYDEKCVERLGAQNERV